MQFLVWTILLITCWTHAYPIPDAAEDFDDVQGKLLPPDYSETESNNYHDIHPRFNKPIYDVEDNVQDNSKPEDNQVDNVQLTENPVDRSHPGDSAYDGFQSIDNHYTNIKPNENPDKNIDVYYSEDDISDTLHPNSSGVIQSDDNGVQVEIGAPKEIIESNVDNESESDDELLLHGVNCIHKSPKTTCQILRDNINNKDNENLMKEEENKVISKATTYITTSPIQKFQGSLGTDGIFKNIRNTNSFMQSTKPHFNYKLLLLQNTSNDL